jgi:hypothetical protein
MPRLYLITVPGLTVASEWAPVHDRLLDDFPEVTDVLATTMPATLLIVYEGDANVDAWLQGISDGVLSRRIDEETSSRTRTRNRASGSGSAGSGVDAVGQRRSMRQDIGHAGGERRAQGAPIYQLNHAPIYQLNQSIPTSKGTT